MNIVARNRRARYDYDLQDTYRAGLVLHGHEVKSIKAGNVSLGGSFVRLRAGEAWLANAHISHYQNAPAGGEKRARKLLLSAAELKHLRDGTEQGLHIMPLALRVDRGLVKLDIGMGRARRKTDKRQLIQAREDRRQARKMAR